jgi:hypothetical protein
MTDQLEVGGSRGGAPVSLWQLNLLRVGYLVTAGASRWSSGHCSSKEDRETAVPEHRDHGRVDPDVDSERESQARTPSCNYDERWSPCWPQEVPLLGHLISNSET